MNRSLKTKTTTRLETITPEAGDLSRLEEAVIRMHHGIAVGAEESLMKEDLPAGAAQELREIELRAFVKSGRIDSLDEAGNPATDRIIRALQEKLERAAHD